VLCDELSIQHPVDLGILKHLSYYGEHLGQL
ncbi:hypothetical protein Tco_1436237, partial [Tanacetum coccineum]